MDTPRRGLCCSSASHSIWFIELHCTWITCGCKSWQYGSCPEATSARSINWIQLHQWCHLRHLRHLYQNRFENKSCIMQKNILKGQPNEQQQTQNNLISNVLNVFGLDCCAIPAVWVALNGEQVAKESATGRLIAHETNRSLNFKSVTR